MIRDLPRRIFRVLGWTLVQVLARALRATSPPLPVLCVACRRPVSPGRVPEVGELTVGGTCSEMCALQVIDGAARRRASHRDDSTVTTIPTATRSRSASSQEMACPGPDCSLCNGLPIPGAPPCDRDVVERHQGARGRMSSRVCPHCGHLPDDFADEETVVTDRAPVSELAVPNGGEP